MEKMGNLHISKARLAGKVSVTGAKNSALRLLAASLLSEGRVTLTGYPAKLLDAQIHVDMLRALGKTVEELDDTSVVISEDGPPASRLVWEGRSIRNTLLILGALTARTGAGRVPLPGGCKLGERKYDLHVMLLERLGARVVLVVVQRLGHRLARRRSAAAAVVAGHRVWPALKRCPGRGPQDRLPPAARPRLRRGDALAREEACVALVQCAVADARARPTAHSRSEAARKADLRAGLARHLGPPPDGAVADDALRAALRNACSDLLAAHERDIASRTAPGTWRRSGSRTGADTGRMSTGR